MWWRHTHVPFLEQQAWVSEHPETMHEDGVTPWLVVDGVVDTIVDELVLWVVDGVVDGMEDVVVDEEVVLVEFVQLE